MASAPLLFEFDSSPSSGASAASLAPYRARSGFGWSDASGLKASEGGGPGDGVVLGRYGTFLVDLADGAYDLTVTASATDKGGLAIRAEGSAATPTRVKSLGDLVERDFQVDVRGGRLNLQIAPRSAQGAEFKLSSLAIRPVTRVDAAPSSPTAPVVTMVAPPPSAGSSSATAAMPGAAVATKVEMPATTTAAGMTTSDMDMSGTHPGVGDAFFATPTVVSNRSGNWSDPSTWSTGRVPAAGDRVWVSANTTVTYNVVSDAALDSLSIQPGGKLGFRTDINTRLTVGTLTVLAGATLEVGTTANPVAANVTAEIVIADKAINLATDPDAIGTGLLGWGKVTMRGATKSNFVNLATEPRAGDTTLTVAQVPVGWKAGDRVIVPDTRQIYMAPGNSTAFNNDQLETGIIKSISGTTVTLQQPLRYDHLGARDASGTLRFLPDLTDATRNVTIRSANPSGTRGHVWMTGRADVDLEYVWFRDLGRTINSVPNDQTTYDSNGNPVRYATNQIGRYPLHMHHLVGPMMPQADGYQFTILGDSIDGGDAPNDHKWGIAVHASSYGLIQDNVVYNTAGAGYMTEDGSESYNVFQHNIAIHNDGLGVTDYNRVTSNLPRDFGHAGDGFWFSGPNNIVRNNVAVDSRNAGFDVYFSEFLTGPFNVPLYQGADPMQPGQSRTYTLSTMPFGTMAGNVAYGASEVGLRAYFAQGLSNDMTFQGMNIWNTPTGFLGGETLWRGTLSDFVILGDPSKRSLDPYQPSTGFAMGIGLADGITVTNADVENVGTGIVAPQYTSMGYQFALDRSLLAGQVPNIAGTFTVDGATFRNNLTDVRVDDQTTAADVVFNDRTVVIRNSSFSHTATPSYLAVDNSSGTGQAYWDFRRLQQVLVYGYDRTSGNDFQVFAAQQAPGFVMPQTSADYHLGSIAAGLTNQANWNLYGIAIGGSMAPADAARRSDIAGLVAPIRPIPPGKDTRGPVISNVVASPVSGGSVTVTWTTDEPSSSSIAINGQYVPESGYSLTNLKTNHQAVLTGVSPYQRYDLQVKAQDDAGNFGVGSGSIGRSSAPVIQGVSFAGNPPDSGRLTVNTDVATTAYVDYGLTTSYGSRAYDGGTVAVGRAINIQGLDPFATYHYRVVVTDQYGNSATSADGTFRVMAQPRVVGVADAAYSDSGGWQNLTSDGYGGAYRTHRVSGSTPGTATWNFNGLAPGDYLVYANWYGMDYFGSRVPYTITDGRNLNTRVIANQQQANSSLIQFGSRPYLLLGRVTVTGSTVTVTVADGEPGTFTLAGSMLIAAVG